MSNKAANTLADWAKEFQTTSLNQNLKTKSEQLEVDKCMLFLVHFPDRVRDYLFSIYSNPFVSEDDVTLNKLHKQYWQHTAEFCLENVYHCFKPNNLIHHPLAFG